MKMTIAKGPMKTLRILRKRATDNSNKSLSTSIRIKVNIYRILPVKPIIYMKLLDIIVFHLFKTQLTVLSRKKDITEPKNWVKTP
jgi:hypothetical protein